MNDVLIGQVSERAHGKTSGGTSTIVNQLLVRFSIPFGKRGEVLDVLRCLRGPTEASIGCRGCWILVDADDDRNSLIYLVQWDTRDQLENHVRSERFRKLLPYIELSETTPEAQTAVLESVRGLDYVVATIASRPG